MFKTLGVTCDNTSNNDKMVDHLSTLIDDFPGAANQTQCFNHILNLVTKSILCQFGAPRKNTTVSEDLEDATDILTGFELKLEESAEPVDNNFETDNKNEEDITDDEDLQDNDHEGMSEEEVSELERTLVPVQLMLAKVSLIDYCCCDSA